MIDGRLVGIVTALLLLAGAGGARAEITLEHLIAIDQMLSTNDMAALKDYLDKNPGLLTGDDELSNELRDFHDAASNGSVNYGYTASATDASVDDASARESSFQH